MQEKYCYGCMEILQESSSLCCKCGYEINTPPKEAFYLYPGSILKDRYLIGRCLGSGGFGVTYIGRDLILGNKVAIKEYLPSEFSTRTPHQQTVSVYTGEAARQFEAGLKGFDEEARRLAKLSNIPGVVKIFDVFHENKTSYIVMEYLEGETVSEKLKKSGTFSYKETEEIMSVVLSTLDEVHATGIIHRDVSPGNIFITNDGNIKLIDFGAARFASAYHTKSLSIILKPGYAPEEQYRSKGNQGPWTDVYSAAATMYKMLSGRTPQESVDRMVKDELLPLGKIGVSIDKNKENAIMNALNVNAEERTRSAGIFLNELCGNEKIVRKKESRKKTDEGKFPFWAKIFVAIVPVLIVAAGFMIFNHGTTGANDNFTVVPNVINKNGEEAEKILSEKGLDMVISGTVDVEFGESGLVQKVVPGTGTYLGKGERVEVYLSKNSSVNMPNLLYWGSEDAAEKMEEAGLNTKIEYVETNDFAEGVIIEQEYAEGKVLPKNSLIKIKAAKRTEEQNPSDEIPGIAGMDITDAAKILMESGYGLVVKEEKFDDSPVGTVLEQKNPEDESAVVTVTVSRGEKYAYMKDFLLGTKAEVEEFFKDFGIKINYEYIGTFEYAQDMVLEQKPSAGEKLFEGDEITVSLSLRSNKSFKIGETMTFGSYQQKTNPNAGKDPIEWQILEVQDGKAFVISKYVIEARKVFDNDLGYGRPKWKWETSDFRKWLNKDFINEAFSAEEQDSIIKLAIKNPANPKSGKSGGNNTSDKVFLLSCEEVEKYFPTEKDREAEAVRKVADLDMLDPYGINYNNEWCTRTAGEDAYGPVHIISSTGLMEYDREGSWDTATGLRPAMWLDVYSFSEPEPISSGVKVGDIVTFGSYEQDNNFENGAEAIEWQVLEVKDGKALVISKYGLDCKPYNDSKVNVTWEACSLRKWLNSEFLNDAFNAEEKKSVCTTKLSTPDNPKYGTNGGNDTEDKVFLLSFEEGEKYFPKKEERECELTEYAKQKEDSIWWWSRSPGYPQNCAAALNNHYDTYGLYFASNNVVTKNGIDVNKTVAVRPAMWVDESALTVENEIKAGSVIKFGSYEQDNNFGNGNEPIEWQVLEVKDGKALVISKYGLDCKPYNTLKTDITWETCSLRKWLNSDFINEAFGAKEQQNIAVTKLSNQDNPKTGTKGGKDTEDKVFLLDFVELRTYFDSDNAKQCKATKYAIEKGATKDFQDNCYWWLRSPGVNKNTAIFVDMSGSTNNGVGTYNQYAYCTVRPAMWIDLEKAADDISVIS
ncbi:MAG: PASTA domain-containing protein [Oscillospiraceae bacterium]|nr:PASTA domain-containing protein [Oscillospiraceae bacterium]